jgi:DNA-binding response OmpR family regulator
MWRHCAEAFMSSRVLVVDDDEGIRQLLVAALRRSGTDVDTASDGCDALQKLLLRDYAVVILDVMMPRLDGRSVLAQIMRGPQPRPAVIVTSAMGETDSFADADLVLPKPFDLFSLLAAVKGFLPPASERMSA